MAGPENKFKNRRLKKRLKSFEHCYFFTKEAVGLRGIPDIIGCWNGRFFALEVKANEKSERTVLQKFIIAKIKNCLGFGAFIYPENCDEVLEELTKHCFT